MSDRAHPVSRLFASVLAAWIASILACAACAGPELEVTVPAGFEVSLYADDDLAHDIYSLTIDARGRVVVSGPGYVRILIDQDGDSQADSYETYAEGPASGAQGMYFDGDDLLCTGDGGLIRYRDADGDSRADGDPELLLRVKTGGEHHAHSIQKGPDGWWYLLAGNLAGISSDDVTTASSPVRRPAAGALLRIAPDFSEREVVADGFRNPYDFAFDVRGAIFTYDSDGERDVSLPWYRPTRVFQVLPGVHAGWITASWKRPGYFPDMPPVVASTGRGSPTGVVSYRHAQFPPHYQDGLFVLDWTFGRVMMIPLVQAGSIWRGQPETFMAGRGRFGFAPTDAAVTPAGDLMICVGGRGTRGGVYRVRYVGVPGSQVGGTTVARHTALSQCLAAMQPLSSWSREQWLPVALSLGKSVFVSAALNHRLPTAQRLRAVEIITELFGGLDAAEAERFRTDNAPTVRARAIWSLGLRALHRSDWDVVAGFLADKDPRVTREALSASLRSATDEGIRRVYPELARSLGADDSFVRQAAALVAARLTPVRRQELAKLVAADDVRGQLALALSSTDRRSAAYQPAIERAAQLLRRPLDPGMLRDAARLAQKALGDVGGNGHRRPVYDGYAGRQQSNDGTQALCGVMESIFPSGNRVADHELARLIAMLAPHDKSLVAKLITKLSDDTSPVDDIHYLIVLSRLPAAHTSDQRSRIASALVHLDAKIKDRSLRQDRNWDVRVGEMYRQLIDNDDELPRAVISHPDFGRSGHVVFAEAIDPELQTLAADRIARQLDSDDEDGWTAGVVFLLGKSANPRHRELIRSQFDNLALQGAVILALARHPEASDTEKYVQGLRSPDFAVMRASLLALEQLPSNTDPDLQVSLLQSLRRLGANKQERALRDRVVKQLRSNLGVSFGFRLGLSSSDRQTEAVEKWTDYIKQQFPEQADPLFRSTEDEWQHMIASLDNVEWESGRPERGRELFEKHSCQGCHGTHAALGPDLAGVGARFSRGDLFAAVAFPNRDVSPRYHTTLIETATGNVVSGLVIYESVDGLTLRDSTNQTIRIDADQIEARRELNTSLMPTGLLDGLSQRDLADLYAYLQSL